MDLVDLSRLNDLFSEFKRCNYDFFKTFELFLKF